MFVSLGFVMSSVCPSRVSDYKINCFRPEDSEKYLEEQQQKFRPMIADLQNCGISVSVQKLLNLKNSVHFLFRFYVNEKKSFPDILSKMI